MVDAAIAFSPNDPEGYETSNLHNLSSIILDWSMDSL